MSRWTIAFVSFSVIAFSFAAIAADDSLPRNIELKPGDAPADDAAGQTAEDTGFGTTTRQIVTEASQCRAPRRRPVALLRPERHRLAKPRERRA
ncbi:MAG: hypothetical protein WBE89_16720 [Methyloceanibacter sp.]